MMARPRQAPPVTTWQAKVLRQYHLLRADRRKMSLMLALLVIGALMWGRLLLQQGTPQPAQAIATPAAVPLPTPIAHTPLPDAVEVTMASTVTRDLFALDVTGYTLVRKPEDDRSTPEKSPSTLPDTKPNVSIAGLRLDSTIQGSQPRAMINGELIAVGGKINGFTLREVRSRSVVLEKHGILVTLGM